MFVSCLFAVFLACSVLMPQTLAEFTPGKCGVLNKRCCNIAADAIDCSEGTCLTDSGGIGNSDNGKCNPCGGEGQPCCRPIGGLIPSSRSACNEGLSCDEKNNACQATGGPNETCGEFGQKCCSIAADAIDCGFSEDLTCLTKDGKQGTSADGTCQPCGSPGETCCNRQGGFAPQPKNVCEEGATCKVLKNTSACERSTSTCGALYRPPCPGGRASHPPPGCKLVWFAILVSHILEIVQDFLMVCI
jgi:hypothetical protein